MNRLKFSNGGQPLFLEDIKLLQENQDEILSTLLYALCKDTGIIILKGGDWDVINEDGDVLTVRIAEGKAFVGGDIVGWNETDVSNNLDNDLYLCVQEVDEDEREFGDGVPRKCRTNKRVYFSETTDHAQWYINIFDYFFYRKCIEMLLSMPMSAATVIVMMFILLQITIFL